MGCAGDARRAGRKAGVEPCRLVFKCLERLQCRLVNARRLEGGVIGGGLPAQRLECGEAPRQFGALRQPGAQFGQA